MCYTESMETQTPRRGTAPLVLVIFVPLVLVAAALIANPPDYTLDAAVRGAAMLGYIYVFLACLSSAFLQDIVRYFGRPYLRVHHLVATIGLTLLTLHGLTVARDSRSLAIVLPRFGSVESFLMWGGPPAYILIWVAVIAAVMRLALGAGWRMLHWLNYIAFMLATAHALMIGPDFDHGAVRWAATAMALIVIAVFLSKRFRDRTSQRGGKPQ